jgi:hypothetical protein
MSFLTPYLVYILGAYGLSLSGLCLFSYMTFFQWKRSNQLISDRLKKIKQ